MTSSNESRLNLRMTVYCALFTALIIIGGYISIPIPIGPVPIVLSDFFAMLTGLFLGYHYGLISIVLFLVLGALGLPVFAGGAAGLATLLGPTGGFLFSYLLMAFSIGYITRKKEIKLATVLIALIVGNIMLYAFGVPWLKLQSGLNWPVALTAGLVPFIPGIMIKIIVATTLAKVLLPRFRQMVQSATLPQSDEAQSDEDN